MVGRIHQKYIIYIYIYPETNIFAPENGWLEDDPFLLGKRPIFRGDMLVSESFFTNHLHSQLSTLHNNGTQPSVAMINFPPPKPMDFGVFLSFVYL